jgi:2-phosphosulfolactate phosphatase
MARPDRHRALGEPPDGVGARFVTTAEAAEITGAVVVIDVLRAFTTAAYALAGGAARIFLVATVEEALARKAADPTVLLMGEIGGLAPAGFDLSNSPAHVARADVDGRTIVQRTSAGTQGALAARRATRLWCASLVVASATAAAVAGSGLGAPTYVISGRFAGRGPLSGSDDLATAGLIERARLGQPLDAERVIDEVSTSEEAVHTLGHGPDSAPPEDLESSTRIDAFDFAMEALRSSDGLYLERRTVVPAR